MPLDESCLGHRTLSSRQKNIGGAFPMCDSPRPDLSQRSSQRVGFAATAQSLLVLMACLLAAAHDTAQINPKHFFCAPGQPNTPNPSTLTSDLIYHGGNAGTGAIGVETVPATYLIFWGPDWQNGFTTTDLNGVAYSSQQLQAYVT